MSCICPKAIGFTPLGYKSRLCATSLWGEPGLSGVLTSSAYEVIVRAASLSEGEAGFFNVAHNPMAARIE